MIRICIALCLITISCTLVNAQTKHQFKVVDSFHIKSDGGWDYISVNNNLIYVSHSTQVNILNASNGDSVGVINGTAGVHGIAFATEFNKGFTSNGKLNTATVFNLTTNAILGQIKTGENPDALVYDKFSKRIFIGNGRSKDVTVIDAATNNVVATIPVGGKPEAIVSDETGKVFLNVEDKNEIVVIDVKALQVINHWSIAPGDEPAGLAIDLKNKKLFAGCGNKMLLEVDAVSGKIIDQYNIGNGCDGVAFDSKLMKVYAANGADATLTILTQDATTQKHYLSENITTKKGARTLCVDDNSNKIYLPTANFETTASEGKRAKMLSGSFQVIVVGTGK